MLLSAFTSLRVGILVTLDTSFVVGFSLAEYSSPFAPEYITISATILLTFETYPLPTIFTLIKSDVTVAKNYLSETELKNLNNVVNIFLDIAEDNAERNIPMYMKDWKKEVDNVLTMRHYNILEGKGKISKKEAYEKAEK